MIFTNVMSGAEREQYASCSAETLAQNRAGYTGGPTGTGKTHSLVQDITSETIVVSPTHRAAHVLKTRLPEDIGASTIHSRLVDWIVVRDEFFDENDLAGSVYRENTKLKNPLIDEPTTESIRYRLFSNKARNMGVDEGWMIGVWKELSEMGPISADECSMMSAAIVQKILQLANPGQVHFFGDPYQLTPVGGAPFFLPDVAPSTMLTKQYRQDGPLLRAATACREAATVNEARSALPEGQLPDDVHERCHDGNATVIAWRNATVARFNIMARRHFGYDPLRLAPSEPVIAIETAPDLGVYNNQPLRIAEVRSDGCVRLEGYSNWLGYKLKMAPKLGHVSSLIVEGIPTIELCSAYALTCHKSQGGEWNEVYVLDETRSMYAMNKKRAEEPPHDRWGPQMFFNPTEEVLRWLYTGVTRARHTLVVENAKLWEVRT